MVTKDGLDRSKKQVGKIYKCLWYGYKDIEMMVTGRFNEIEYEHLLDDNFDPKEQVWVARIDGKKFDDKEVNASLRHNNTQDLMNECWLTPLSSEWDSEEN